MANIQPSRSATATGVANWLAPLVHAADPDTRVSAIKEDADHSGASFIVEGLPIGSHEYQIMIRRRR